MSLFKGAGERSETAKEKKKRLLASAWMARAEKFLRGLALVGGKNKICGGVS